MSNFDNVLLSENLNPKIYKDVLFHFGIDAQKQKAIEELEELSKALKLDNDRQNIIEEIADVLNMIRQLAVIYDISDYNIANEMNGKMQRTIQRIQSK